MRVTVCVATKNRTDMLHQLLWSLIRQAYDKWDLVIVDDSDVPVKWESLGVYPRLFSEILRTGHDIRLVPGPKVSRIGAAYQVGLQASSPENPLFLRVDDDSWLEPDYLKQLTDIMQDDQVGACGGLFLHPGSEIEMLRSHDERLGHATIEGLSDQINIQWYRHETGKPIPVEHLTANILFNRGWLERIGGFETNLYHQHRDETQATWRLHVEGAQLLVHPRAIAWHLRGVNGGARGHRQEVYLEDHRRFMAQRRTMKPGIHVNLGHAIGDGLMATPMLRSLREANPDRNISVFAPWAEAVLTGNRDVDEIAKHPLDAQRTVRLEQSIYSWASANQWKGHLAEAYCKMVNLPVPSDVTPRLFLTEEECAVDLPTKELIVIAPWSNARTFDFYKPSGNKNWPLERWSNVVRWLQGKGFVVAQLRGSDEEPAIDEVDIHVCGRPLRHAFVHIARARLVLSVDTMAHHAAAALGVPAVVLWGRSKWQHFGYSKASIINLQGECPGIAAPPSMPGSASNDASKEIVMQIRPCIGGDQWAMDQHACPLEEHPCMSAINVADVKGAAEKLLGA